jgi:flagellum-specific ATP synthase
MGVELPRCPVPSDYSQTLALAGLPRIQGTVAAVAGNQVRVRGMAAPVGADCRLFSRSGSPISARVIGFVGSDLLLAPLGPLVGLAAGDIVTLERPQAMIRVGEGLKGRVLDAVGQPIDNRPLPGGLQWVPVDQPAPKSLQRPPIKDVLPTGVRAIDGLLTCGRGQRVGIFAGSGVGKSSLLAMLARGTAVDVAVIGLVGERGREVNEFLQHTLGEEGRKKSVLVVATSDEPAPLRVQAALTATAIAEYFRDCGKQVLLMIDSITRLAHAQRELGLAAGEPPTTRGYPPSVFSMLPRLVERAGVTERGAISAFYSVLVDGGDTDEPVSDALRGLLDGHIVLNRQLGSQGHWPAIDCLASLSRLHHHIAPAIVRDAASRVRRHLSEYKKNEDLISIGAYRAGSNPTLDQAIAAGDPIRQFLIQPMDQTVPWQQTQQLMATLP